MKNHAPLKAIVYFDIVMKTGSFKVAATHIGVSPGAVGQQISKLETWLKLDLFIRETRKIRPTDTAINYWRQVKPALEKIDAINIQTKRRNQSM
ncbi:helix-turn-helix domain-containing protein [Pseudomonas protegens]|uniref:LysR family transcriptional regulator n=1 Tax=Pseudomonas protegens TaxID=380021 RepID=UPI001B33F49F